MCWLAHILAAKWHLLNFSAAYYTREHERMLHRFKLSASRCWYGRPGCDHHFFFGNTIATPPIIMSFGTLIPNLTSEFEKIDRTDNSKILKLQWRTKKSKFDNFSKKWSYRLQMTGGFQIWSQKFKSNDIWPHFGEKTVENRQNPVFDHFFCQKGSNVNQYRFWDQIWNLLVICGLYDPFLLKLSNFEFFGTTL